MASIIRRIAVLLGAPVTVYPCGKVYVRIRDHWLPL